MGLPFELSEYKSRQDMLFRELPDSSILIIPTNDRKIRSNDVGYPFRPNSYMLYLCGWEEDEGVFRRPQSKRKIWSLSYSFPPEIQRRKSGRASELV